MPTFNPPLARETSIPISSSDADRFVHLHFTLAFEPTEDTSGTWELWTDIADVNLEGQVATQPGEWRNVNFIPKQPTIANGDESHDDATDESATTIKLTSTPITQPALPAFTELVADMIVPAHNASYAYTYRRVTTSGETHWLGNGSDNGVVRVFEGEQITPQPQVMEWEGIGIELPTDGSAPIIQQLPNEQSTDASILLLRSTTPLVQPTHLLADTPAKHAGSTHSSLVILSRDLKPVHVEAKATAPTASGIKLLTDDHRSIAALFNDACRDEAQVRLIEEGNNDVVAFTYSPSEESNTSHLVVYAPRLAKTQIVKPQLPTLRGSAPIAICADANGNYQFVDADQVSDVKVQLLAGKIASVVSFAQFIALEHEDETHWIAGVGASNQEVKEEDVPAPSIETKEPIKPPQIEHVEIAPDSTPMTKSRSSQSIPESETSTVDSERSVSVTRRTEPSSFLLFLRKFFFSLWSWLFAPFGYGETKATNGEAIGDDRSSASSTGLLTPHERTPLLDSPGTSQATSSTAVSPFTTPKTGGTAMLKTLSDSSTNTDDSTPIARRAETLLTRKYAQFTFERAPLHLLFAPGFGSRIHPGLSLSSRQSGDKSWKKHDVEPTKGPEGHCDEVVIEQDQHAGPWEVQVEFQ